MMETENRISLAFDVSPKEFDELEKIREVCGLNDLFSVINTSLNLLQWAITTTKNQRYVASVDERSKKYRILNSPILDRVAQKSTNKVTLV